MCWRGSHKWNVFDVWNCWRKICLRNPFTLKFSIFDHIMKAASRFGALYVLGVSSFDHYCHGIKKGMRMTAMQRSSTQEGLWMWWTRQLQMMKEEIILVGKYAMPRLPGTVQTSILSKLQLQAQHLQRTLITMGETCHLHNVRKSLKIHSSLQGKAFFLVTWKWKSTGQESSMVRQ